VCRRFSKVRLSFVPHLAEIRLTVVPQLAVSEDLEFETVRFSSPTLSCWWSFLAPPHDRKDPYYHEALFRLLTLFCGTIISGAMVKSMVSAIGPEFAINDTSI